MAKNTCPKCGSTNTAENLYGDIELSENILRKEAEGKYRLMGCVVSVDDCERYCNDCGHEFDIRPNVYLDIDGVLLANDLTPANHAKEFLQKVLKLYPDTTYWLTTHCQGDASVPIQHIGHLFDDETVELMKRIKPTRWQTAKTRAIDFSKPFLWFDDDLFYEEKETLIKKNALENWIEVDLTKDPDQMGKFVASFPFPYGYKYTLKDMMTDR